MTDYSVQSSAEIYSGRVVSLRRDEVRMPDGQVGVREVVSHPGAVVVVALDDRDRVVLIRQYRHPARGYLWELPAGLLDVDGESAHDAVRRELAEEAGLTAGTWHTLLDLRTSPGFTDEAVRVYLARELSEVGDDDRFVGEHEESDLTIERVELAEAVRRVLAGQIQNAVSVAGILAAHSIRFGAGLQTDPELRAANAPWPARPDLRP